jgi:hypothetical protein
VEQAVEESGPQFDSVVRTHLVAAIAANAAVFVDDRVFFVHHGNGLHRTGVPAGRLGALAAVNRNEIRAFFYNAYQPGPDLQGVFLFAGHFASMASHAVIFFDNQNMLSHFPPPIVLHSG